MATATETCPTQRGNYRSYSTVQKLRALDIAGEMGVRKAASFLKIPKSSLASWKSQLQKGVQAGKKTGRPITYPLDQEQQIHDWVIRQRELHLPVTRFGVAKYAMKVVKTPGFKASNGWLDKFMKRNELVMRARTSVAQHLPRDLQERTRVFQKNIRELHLHHDFQIVINMDETPTFFDLVPGKTVDTKGVRQVIIKTTGAEKRHVTVVLAVASNGDRLPPLVIFKGQRLPKDITKIPEGVFVEMALKGWMTEAIMVRWISNVIAPYTKKNPCLLIMDSYKAHLTLPVRQEQGKWNITSAIIPGGCTSKLQPLDVAINKPFKDNLRALWSEWISQQTEMAGDGRVKTASRQTILEWVADAWAKIPSSAVQSSFPACGISQSLSQVDDTTRSSRISLMHNLTTEDSDSEFEGFQQEDVPFAAAVGPDPFDSDECTN